MDLTIEQQNSIRKYICNDEAIRKMTDYLLRHEIIGEEIFPYLGEEYSNWGERTAYYPVAKETFIRRLPFYFYKPDHREDQVGNLSQYVSGIYSDRISGKNDSEDDVKRSIEKLYCILETMFYDYSIDIKTIFEYPVNQTGYCSRTDILFQWAHYLELAHQYGVNEKTPKHFIVDYNFLLERANLPPVIYELREYFMGEYIQRSGNVFSMEGIFPCDNHGQPILRWIGVKIKNASKIWADVNHRMKGRLFVEATPKTMIWGLNCWGTNDDGSDEWYELYMAPLLMEFDYTALKRKRNSENLTQQQIADTIGASVRTYQKWESGVTMPDCHYLLRLMNVLNITETKELVCWIDPDDKLPI